MLYFAGVSMLQISRGYRLPVLPDYWLMQYLIYEEKEMDERELNLKIGIWVPIVSGFVACKWK